MTKPSCRGSVFIFSGPSGVGKSTLLGAVQEKYPSLRYSVSFTTRAPRQGEIPGVDYHFVSEAVFRNMVETGEFAEWAEVHGCLYGTSAKQINAWLRDGQSVLLDVDVEGAKRLFDQFPSAISVFIAPPSLAELERRLTSRGKDASETVKRRLTHAEAEMTHSHLYDYLIVNDDLAEALSAVGKIIEKGLAGQCHREAFFSTS